MLNNQCLRLLSSRTRLLGLVLSALGRCAKMFGKCFPLRALSVATWWYYTVGQSLLWVIRRKIGGPWVVIIFLCSQPFCRPLMKWMFRVPPRCHVKLTLEISQLVSEKWEGSIQRWDLGFCRTAAVEDLTASPVLGSEPTPLYSSGMIHNQYTIITAKDDQCDLKLEWVAFHTNPA